MKPLRRCALLICGLLIGASPAPGSVLPEPMRTAVDQYAEGYAHEQGWQYVDRINGRGDYRHGYFRLIFITEAQAQIDGHPAGRVSVTWDVEARAARCGPGWYRVATPDDRATCPGKAGGKFQPCSTNQRLARENSQWPWKPRCIW